MHQSVLLQASIEGLNIRPDGIYIDATFGRGGHSQEILNYLSPHGRLIAVDKDQEAIAFAKKTFDSDARFLIFHGSFAHIKQLMAELDLVGKVDGILMDLGVSSPQLDTPERGFSFMHSGPLDMRMNRDQRLDAATFINKATVKELSDVFKTYGEERYAKRIANAIAIARTASPILTTERLAAIVKEAHPRWEKHKHPATRVFQAIRIHINQELEDLSQGLKQSVEVLAAGGRLVVISFHSLEDRLVKQFMREEASGKSVPPGVPIKACEMQSHFRRIGKAIKPSESEVQQNVRARSAVMRIGEKIA